MASYIYHTSHLDEPPIRFNTRVIISHSPMTCKHIMDTIIFTTPWQNFQIIKTVLRSHVSLMTTVVVATILNHDFSRFFMYISIYLLSAPRFYRRQVKGVRLHDTLTEPGFEITSNSKGCALSMTNLLVS